ncbi:MAG: SDR family NAD(P)-dependent oxidoreductase [Sphingomonadales bacterium]|nr:SDR family NAD(P)-dependent oxidoreductase [Sphingomonadaceae bacterium]MBS3932540.1 SDR family NAD(P)-dependent oxidoreductase [Sphingomonadales bacterium]
MNSKRLAGRVMIITGAGRGIGREYALLAAREGAKVVVNDLGSGLHGEASEETPAQEVVAQIIAEGGEAIADHSDVSDFEATGKMVRRAIETFGDLHVLVNNAGILRDRMLVNMSPEEWDLTIRVHLRGHYCMSHHAAVYWRAQAKANGPSDRVLISTSSISGLHGAAGQTNYASAKAGLATFALLCHRELNANYGVRCYAIAPGARTRLTGSTPHAKQSVGQEVEAGTFDFASPSNVAPFVMWLTAEGCPVPSGAVFGVAGDKVDVYRPWEIGESFSAGDRQWTFEALDAAASDISAAIPALAKTQAEKAREKDTASV